MSNATAAVSSDLKKLEQIAPRIKRRHEEYQDRSRRQEEALKALEGKYAKALPQELDGLSIQDRAPRRTSYGERPALDARNMDNHSLAARLAQREVRRRDTQRRSVRQAGVSEEEEQERRTGGEWGTWDDEYARQSRTGDDLSSQIQEVARLQREGQRSSYSPVGRVVKRRREASLTATAPALAVLDISIQLPLRTAHIRTGSLVTIKLTSSSSTITASPSTERADLQIFRHTCCTTTSPTKTLYSLTTEPIRSLPTTSRARQIHTVRSRGTSSPWEIHR